MFAQLREGWQYVTGFLPIRNLLLLFAVVSLMGMPYTVLMPVFASQVLHGGAHTLGFLMGAAGVGALVSAVLLALRRTVKGLLRMVPISAALFGAGLVAFGFSHILWLSLALMLVVGFGMMQGMAASNTIIQTLAPADKRGRVMSYYTMAFVGMAPFGSSARRRPRARRERLVGRCHHRKLLHPRRSLVLASDGRRPRRHPTRLSRARHHPASARDKLNSFWIQYR